MRIGLLIRIIRVSKGEESFGANFSQVLDKETVGESLVAMMSYRLRDLIDGRQVDGRFNINLCAYCLCPWFLH